ncbi:MAG: ABC transporter permease [Geminicoccaceae bacterium]
MESWRQHPLVFWTFLLPGGLWLVLFFLAPLSLIWAFSFGERSGPVDILITGTLSNYIEALDPLYLAIFLKSLWIAAAATVVALIIGFPVALAISFAPARVKPVLLLLVILPFWTNLLIRTYAMIAVLRTRGYVNFGLEAMWDGASGVAETIGIGSLPRFQPLTILYNDAAVVIGIVYVYLPFMVLPLYATLERLDRSFLEASLDLGAGQLRTMASIVLPLAKPGIISGIILVFIPALGTFLISDLLGGPNSQLIGNVIERQFKAANNWPLGAAMSFILLYITFGALALRSYLGRDDG